MDETAHLATALRRIGFGPGPGELDELLALSPLDRIDRVMARVRVGDPWPGVEIDEDRPLRNGPRLALRWVEQMRTGPAPLTERMVWFWHGLLVSSVQVVPAPELLTRQIDLFRERGRDSFRDLLRSVTIDPAMLVYLDGVRSTGGAPNENYGRELLELFALGVGNYTEDDVQAAATALTGWAFRRDSPEPRLVPWRHNDSPQEFLGRSGVHDLDTVIDTIVEHPACARHIVGELASVLIGPATTEADLDRYVAVFTVSDLDIETLLGELVRDLLDPDRALVSRPLPPVDWLVGLGRALDVALDDEPIGRELFASGQVPLFPPNVSGWPSGDAWLSTSAMIGRRNLAVLLASRAPEDGPAMEAAGDGDLAALATSLGRPEGFLPASIAVLDQVRSAGSPVTVLAAALTAPELMAS